MFNFRKVPIRRRSDKVAILQAVLIGLGILAIVFMFVGVAKAQPVCVSGNCEHEHHTTHVSKRGDRVWLVPAVIVGAGVWCWFKCRKDEPAAAKPDPKPLTITPPKEPEVFTVRPAQ